MKKLFFMFFLAASASVAMAQSQKLFDSNSSFRATLAEFSYNGKAQIFLRNWMDENGKVTFTFYSDDFEKQGELTVSCVEVNASYKHEERERKDDGFKGDWKVLNEDTHKSYEDIISLSFDDFDQSCDDFRTIYLSQTIFNTDEKYEFLMPLFSSSSTPEIYEEDRDGDGVIDARDTYTNTSMIGFQIVSEDGTVLQTVNFDNGFRTTPSKKTQLLKINDKLHLCFEGYTDNSSAILLYSINPTASSVRMMKMEKVSSVATGTYSLSGRAIRGEKGVNIIRMSDGTTKKVLVQ